MIVRIVPYNAEQVTAVRAFNERMVAGRAATDFLLPDRPNTTRDSTAPEPSITWTKYVAVDDAGDVRGGFLLMKQSAWLNARPVPVVNYQAPLSEGILDKRFGLVAMHMLKYVQRHWPHAFVVGMGNADRPLPRLLTAAGWTVRPVPFMFRIVRPSRVLRELRPLQRQSYVSAAARLGAVSGAGWVATELLQCRGRLARYRSRELQITRLDRWDPWADHLWERVRDLYSFTVVRDRCMLDRLYPLQDGRCIAYLVRNASGVLGWAVCLQTAMRNHEYFGNLTVATVLDTVSAPEHARSVISLVSETLAESGADLLVTNQSHALWLDGFRRSGFLRGPSNYLLAMSKPLADAIGSSTDRIHVSRGDGDGRLHL
jgi:hypothetical protein